MRSRAITVIITNWNYGMFLREAIESVLAQTVLPHKIIIADDGSSDESIEIEKEYYRRYPHLFIIKRNPERQGLPKNLNGAIALVQTPYYCALAADDKFAPTYLEKSLQVIHKEASERLFVVYTDMVKFGLWEGVWQVSDWDESALRQGNYINGHAVLKTDIVREAGCYRTEVNGDESFFEDYYLYMDIVNLGKNYYGVRIPEALVYYRRHDYGHRTDKTDLNKRK